VTPALRSLGIANLANTQNSQMRLFARSANSLLSWTSAVFVFPANLWFSIVISATMELINRMFNVVR
jgi:hypothetical protein